MAQHLPAEMLPAFRLTISAFRAKEYKNLADLMPRTTEQCLDHPPIRLLLHDQVIGRPALQAFIHAELIHLTKQLNVANTMDTAQMLFTADTILDEFNTDTLADMVLVFRRGSQGYYGTTYHQLDCSIVVGWIKRHLDEKATLLERQVAKKRQEDAQAKVDYKAYQDRIEAERAKQREEKIEAFVKSTEVSQEQEFKKGYKAPTAEQVRMADAIRSIASKRYAPLHGGQFKDFFNYEVQGHRIFAKSELEAFEIYEEAILMINLNQPTK